MDILLVAPYFGGSHRAWAAGYAQHSRHHVTLLTLPARFWKWRMHGGALTLAALVRERNLHADLLLVTDMLNVPTFLALTRDRFHDTPVALYCHENQLTYPLQAHETRDFTYPMFNWLSMVAADRILFNSRYHMETWFESLTQLLKQFPDYTHTAHIPDVHAKSAVLPVGCGLSALDAARPSSLSAADKPLILWNQRWEYDKAPETFFRALDVLMAEGVAFEVALTGGGEHQQGAVFAAARERWGGRVIHYGRADYATYQRLLWQADIVVSTALHEFFGIAIVEAVYCHTFPILPHRLVYPDIIPSAYHAHCLYDDFESLVTRLWWALIHPAEIQHIANALKLPLAHYDWKNLVEQYDGEMAEILR